MGEEGDGESEEEEEEEKEERGKAVGEEEEEEEVGAEGKGKEIKEECQQGNSASAEKRATQTKGAKGASRGGEGPASGTVMPEHQADRLKDWVRV